MTTTPQAPPLAQVLPLELAQRLQRASQEGRPGSMTRRAAIERETERIKRDYPMYFTPEP